MNETKLMRCFDRQHHLPRAKPSVEARPWAPRIIQESYFSDIEASEVLLEGVPFDQQVEKITAALISQNLQIRFTSAYALIRIELAAYQVQPIDILSLPIRMRR